MSSSNLALTLVEACTRLGLDPKTDDLQAGLQGAFQRALRAARNGPDGHVSPEHYHDLLDAYRYLRRLTPTAPGERRFEDWPSHISISPAEALTGGVKSGTLPTGRHFTTRLPRALRDGDLVWVMGWLIQARIENAESMAIKGDDLWITDRKPVSALRAGKRISVETPMGPWSFKLSDEAVERRLVRIPGAGLPAARRHEAGDLYVQFEIEVEKGATSLLRRLQGKAA